MSRVVAIPYTGQMTILGVTDKPIEFPAVDETQGLRVAQMEIPFQGHRRFFVQAPSDNILKTEDHIVLKVGHICDSSGALISLQDLASHVRLYPTDFDRMQGNGLLMQVDLSRPFIAVYRCVLSTASIFYWAGDTDLVLSDNLRYVVDFLGERHFEERVLPHHFLFRCTWGDLTYVKNVQQLSPGKFLKWEDDRVTVRHVGSMRHLREDVHLLKLDEDTLESVDDEFNKCVEQYVRFAEEQERGIGTLLSGGVDSSYLEAVVGQNLTSEDQPKSFSYKVDVAAFQPEVEYALYASKTLNTKHSFITVTANNFAESLVEMIRMLGQTPSTEDDPCMLVVARFLYDARPEVSFVFEGSGADVLLGTSHAPIWWQMDRLNPFMKVDYWLRAVEVLMRRVNPDKAFILRKVIELAPHASDPTSFYFPGIDTEMYTDFDQVVRCFGEEAIKNTLLWFQENERENYRSDSIIERAHMMSYFALLLPDITIRNSLFRLHNIDLIQPYVHQSFVEIILSIDPQERFYHKGTVKPISKWLLKQRVDFNVEKPKLGGGIYQDLVKWMREGVLRDMVMSIDRPGFISRSDFENKLADPDWFTWNMLTFDLFQKHVLQE